MKAAFLILVVALGVAAVPISLRSRAEEAATNAADGRFDVLTRGDYATFDMATFLVDLKLEIQGLYPAGTPSIPANALLLAEAIPGCTWGPPVTASTGSGTCHRDGTYSNSFGGAANSDIVTCSLTVDNVLTSVKYNGQQVVVSGNKQAWTEVKTISFAAAAAGSGQLEIQGYELSGGNCGCKCSGLTVVCTAATGSPWNGWRTNPDDWIAYGSNTATSTPTAFDTPCLSSSRYALNAAGFAHNGKDKIWPANGAKYAWFKGAPKSAGSGTCHRDGTYSNSFGGAANSGAFSTASSSIKAALATALTGGGGSGGGGGGGGSTSAPTTYPALTTFTYGPGMTFTLYFDKKVFPKNTIPQWLIDLTNELIAGSKKIASVDGHFITSFETASDLFESAGSEAPCDEDAEGGPTTGDNSPCQKLHR